MPTSRVPQSAGVKWTAPLNSGGQRRPRNPGTQIGHKTVVIVRRRRCPCLVPLSGWSRKRLWHLSSPYEKKRGKRPFRFLTCFVSSSLNVDFSLYAGVFLSIQKLYPAIWWGPSVFPTPSEWLSGLWVLYCIVACGRPLSWCTLSRNAFYEVFIESKCATPVTAGLREFVIPMNWSAPSCSFQRFDYDARAFIALISLFYRMMSQFMDTTWVRSYISDNMVVRHAQSFSVSFLKRYDLSDFVLPFWTLECFNRQTAAWP